LPRKGDIDPALGPTIRRLREQRGYTQEALAHEAGITTGSLARIERGTANASWSTVRAIADALGVKLVDLARRVERED